MNADSRAGLESSVRNQLQEAAGTRMLLSESALPGMKLMPVDLFFFRQKSLMLLPLVAWSSMMVCQWDRRSARSSQLASHKEIRSLREAITQGMMYIKMGWSDAYIPNVREES